VQIVCLVRQGTGDRQLAIRILDSADVADHVEGQTSGVADCGHLVGGEQ
jgi:hypothetical protein